MYYVFCIINVEIGNIIYLLSVLLMWECEVYLVCLIFGCYFLKMDYFLIYCLLKMMMWNLLCRIFIFVKMSGVFVGNNEVEVL